MKVNCMYFLLFELYVQARHLGGSRGSQDLLCNLWDLNNFRISSIHFVSTVLIVTGLAGSIHCLFYVYILGVGLLIYVYICYM